MSAVVALGEKKKKKDGRCSDLKRLMHDLKDLDFFQKKTIFSWGTSTFTPEMPHLFIHDHMQKN